MKNISLEDDQYKALENIARLANTDIASLLAQTCDVLKKVYPELPRTEVQTYAAVTTCFLALTQEQMQSMNAATINVEWDNIQITITNSKKNDT